MSEEYDRYRLRTKKPDDETIISKEKEEAKKEYRDFLIKYYELISK